MKKLLSTLSIITVIIFTCSSCSQKKSKADEATIAANKELHELVNMLSTKDMNIDTNTLKAYPPSAMNFKVETRDTNFLRAFLAPSALERDGDEACAPKKHNTITTAIIRDGDWQVFNWTQLWAEQKAKETLLDQLLDFPPTCMAIGIGIAIILFSIITLGKKLFKVIRKTMPHFIEKNKEGISIIGRMLFAYILPLITTAIVAHFTPNQLLQMLGFACGEIIVIFIIITDIISIKKTWGDITKTLTRLQTTNTINHEG